MAHPLQHATSSARRFGGRAEDYLAIHEWFDASKAHYALPAHRALRHHSAGIFEAERLFGTTIETSASRRIPVRFIGEQHVLEDCRFIPTVQDWLKHLHIEAWMVTGAGPARPASDPRDEWREAVASGRTTLGLADWEQRRTLEQETPPAGEN